MQFIISNDIEKSYVKGHFVLRAGRKVWIRPYEDRRSRKPQQVSVKRNFDKKSDKAINISKKSEFSNYEKHPSGYIDVNGGDVNSNNYLLRLALDASETIQDFDPEEKSNFNHVLENCKSIVSKLGYLDENILHLFKPSSAKPEPIDPSNIRTIRSINKEAKKAYIRVEDSNMKEHVAGIVKGTEL